MHEQDALAHLREAAMLEREKKRLTLTLALNLRLFRPRVREENQKSPHWACHRHLSMVGLFYCWFVKTSTVRVRVFCL